MVKHPVVDLAAERHKRVSVEQTEASLRAGGWTGLVDWLRLAAAQLLGALETRPRRWDGNTLDGLNDHLLRDVGLTRDELGVVRSPEHRLVVPSALDVLHRPGAAAMLDVTGRPLPLSLGRRRR